MLFSFVRAGDPLIHASGYMRIIISRFGAEQFVRGVDNGKFVVGFAIVAGAEILEDQSVLARIRNVVGTSAAADDLSHLIKNELSEVKAFILDNAVEYLLLEGIELVIAAVLGSEAFSKCAG